MNIYYFEDKLKTAIYVFPLGNDLFNVGCCRKLDGKKFNIKSFINEFVEKNLNKKYNTCGSWETPLKGAFLRSGLSGIDNSVDGRVVLAGEACGTTNPFSGEGIANALKSGSAAGATIVKCLTSGDQKKILLYKKYLKKEITRIQRPYKIAEKLLVKRIIRNWFYSNLCKLQVAKEHNLKDNVPKKNRIKLYSFRKMQHLLMKR